MIRSYWDSPENEDVELHWPWINGIIQRSRPSFVNDRFQIGNDNVIWCLMMEKNVYLNEILVRYDHVDCRRHFDKRSSSSSCISPIGEEWISTTILLLPDYCHLTRRDNSQGKTMTMNIYTLFSENQFNEKFDKWLLMKILKMMERSIKDMLLILKNFPKLFFMILFSIRSTSNQIQYLFDRQMQRDFNRCHCFSSNSLRCSVNSRLFLFLKERVIRRLKKAKSLSVLSNQKRVSLFSNFLAFWWNFAVVIDIQDSKSEIGFSRQALTVQASWAFFEIEILQKVFIRDRHQRSRVAERRRKPTMKRIWRSVLK